MNKTIKSTSIFLYSIYILSCNSSKKDIENPLEFSRQLCSCLSLEYKKASVDSIGAENCSDSTVAKSRFLKIKMLYDSDPVSAKKIYLNTTLDSAKKFYSDVLFILDSMCFNKLDLDSIKKKPHIQM